MSSGPGALQGILCWRFGFGQKEKAEEQVEQREEGEGEGEGRKAGGRSCPLVKIS